MAANRLAATFLIGFVGSMPLAAALEQTTQEGQLLQTTGAITRVDVRRNAVALAQQEQGSLPSMPETEFNVNADTVITKAGVRLKPADLQASDERVNVQYLRSGTNRIARRIDFQPPAHLLHVAGEVESVDLLHKKVTLKATDALIGAQRLAFAVDESTIIIRGGHRSFLAELKAADSIQVEYGRQPGRLTAYAILVRQPDERSLFGVRGGLHPLAPSVSGYSSTSGQ